MLVYARISILSPRYLDRILHRKFANCNRRMKKELEDEEIPSPLSLLLHALRHGPDVDMSSITIW